MNKFIQHLKEKGYKVIEDKAILLDKTFKICSGYIDTAMGGTEILLVGIASTY